METELVSTLCLGVPLYSPATGNISDTFKSDLFASFSNASDYSDFSGNSRRGIEGRWIGYRHTANQGQAIVLYGSSLYYCNIMSSSSGSFYQIV